MGGLRESVGSGRVCILRSGGKAPAGCTAVRSMYEVVTTGECRVGLGEGLLGRGMGL